MKKFFGVIALIALVSCSQTPASPSVTQTNPPAYSQSVSVPTNAKIVGVSCSADCPADDRIIVSLSGPGKVTVNGNLPTYQGGGIGKNKAWVYWHRVPGQTYALSAGDNSVKVRIAYESEPKTAAIRRVEFYGMSHSWILNQQIDRICNPQCKNVPDAAKNAALESGVTALSKAGAKGIRLEIEGNFIWGGTNGNLDGTGANWSRYDYIIGLLKKHGMTVLPTCLQYGAPRIAAMTQTTFANAEDYATYCHTVSKYLHSKGIEKIELMNEPNQSFWFTGPDNGTKIATYLKSAYAAVKSADPQMFVYAPGLANGGGRHHNMFDTLQHLYAAGCHIGTCWDGLSVHNFAWSIPPSQHIANREGEWQNYKTIEAIAATHGEHPQICLTETGFSRDAGALGVEPNVAAYEMSEAYILAESDPQVSCVVNASIWDGDDGGSMFATIGLGTLNTTFTPNPSYKVFNTFAH